MPMCNFVLCHLNFYHLHNSVHSIFVNDFSLFFSFFYSLCGELKSSALQKVNNLWSAHLNSIVLRLSSETRAWAKVIVAALLYQRHRFTSIQYISRTIHQYPNAYTIQTNTNIRTLTRTRGFCRECCCCRHFFNTHIGTFGAQPHTSHTDIDFSLHIPMHMKFIGAR